MVARHVVAVCPIRNRGWVVGQHHQCLYDQTTRLRGIFYLEGDSEDDTVEQLRRLESSRAKNPPTTVEHLNSGSPYWHRSIGEKYTGDEHRHLAETYNHMIDRALALFPEASHLWLVDSDVLPEPGCLEKLLAADVDVIAPVVQHSENAFNFMVNESPKGEPVRTAADKEAAAGNYDRPDVRLDGLFPATFVSCCVLYRREVLERRVKPLPPRTNEDGVGARESGFTVHQHRFAPHPRSHDFSMMASLRAAGIKLFVHPLARAEHRMKEPENV